MPGGRLLLVLLLQFSADASSWAVGTSSSLQPRLPWCEMLHQWRVQRLSGRPWTQCQQNVACSLRPADCSMQHAACSPLHDPFGRLNCLHSLWLAVGALLIAAFCTDPQLILHPVLPAPQMIHLATCTALTSLWLAVGALLIAAGIVISSLGKPQKAVEPPPNSGVPLHGPDHDL